MKEKFLTRASRFKEAFSRYILGFGLSLLVLTSPALVSAAPLRDPDMPPQRPRPARPTGQPTRSPTLTLDDLLTRYPKLRSVLCEDPIYPLREGEFLLPISMYHGFAGKSELSVDAQAFEEQLALLRALNYTPLTMSEVSEILSDTQRLPARPVALTFDDSWRSQYEVAYPLLLAYDMRGTFFVIAHQRRGSGTISVDELKTMAAHGMEIGSHTRSHAHLTNIKDGAAWWEINSSREVLQEHLGLPITSFCYPYGGYDERTIRMVKNAGYTVAVATGGTLFQRTKLRYALRRLEVNSNTDLITFAKWLPWRAPELCQPTPTPTPPFIRRPTSPESRRPR